MTLDERRAGDKKRTPQMGEPPPLTRREILINVQRLCRSFARNMAYYRAGWVRELRPLFDPKEEGGNFWIAVNNNFLDMCVLDWCKLFGGRNENHAWKRIVTDPDSFKMDLLKHLGLDETSFAEQIRIFLEYRNKWVAHLDGDRKGLYPRLEVAKKAVWFYYERIGSEQVDPEMSNKTIQTGYRECEEEARRVYRQALQNRRL